MHSEFWLNKWSQGQTGFHQDSVNNHLKTFWSKTSLSEGARVLVPLCGKSKDMLWLCEHGYNVTGVELSDVALNEFFTENEISFVECKNGDMNYCQVRPDFSLICSDFFHVSSEELGEIDAVYDRAALIALPPEMRVDYVNHMNALLQSGARVFLIAVEYDQSKMYGPPFSVPEAEINALFSEKFEIELVYEEDVKFTRSEMAGEKTTEKIYLLTKK